MTELAALSSVELGDLIKEAIDTLNSKLRTLKHTFPHDGTIMDMPVHHHLVLSQECAESCKHCSVQDYEYIRTGDLKVVRFVIK